MKKYKSSYFGSYIYIYILWVSIRKNALSHILVYYYNTFFSLFGIIFLCENRCNVKFRSLDFCILCIFVFFHYGLIGKWDGIRKVNWFPPSAIVDTIDAYLRPWPSSVAGAEPCIPYGAAAVVLIDTSVVVRSARGLEPPGELFCGSWTRTASSTFVGHACARVKCQSAWIILHEYKYSSSVDSITACATSDPSPNNNNIVYSLQ